MVTEATMPRVGKYTGQTRYKKRAEKGHKVRVCTSWMMCQGLKLKFLSRPLTYMSLARMRVVSSSTVSQKAPLPSRCRHTCFAEEKMQNNEKI